MAFLATLDPRSNTTRVRLWERVAIAAGEYECVAVVLKPDGTLWRGAGHFEPVPDMPPGPRGRVMECVANVGPRP